MNQVADVLCRIYELLRRTITPMEQEFWEVRGNTTPVSRVSDATQVLAHRNELRSQIWVHNASDETLFIGLTNDINTNKYALRIAGQDALIVTGSNYPDLYKEELYGFWESGAAATSKCMVTEFSKIKK